MIRAVDTSVVIKWFVAEEGQELAEKLIGQPLIAPDLLLPEVSNVAWKKWRIKEIDREQAAFAQTMTTSFVDLVAGAPFSARALQIAFELDHPVYDCFFIALCEVENIRLVTADQRLLRRCSGTAFEALLEPLA